MTHHQTGAGQLITSAVASWPEVELGPHRFGGVEFRLGRRELGHLHGDRIADLPFPRRVRDELIAAGRARPHHVYRSRAGSRSRSASRVTWIV